MNLRDARIGDRVIYHPHSPHAPKEEGTVTSVNEKYVFVRYQADNYSKATYPEDLTFVTERR